MTHKFKLPFAPAVGVALALSVSLACKPVLADVWVFEPSVTLDQRVDDNYYLLPTDTESSLSATRAVGELGFSRESEIFSIRGIARIDALLTTSTDVGEENLDSNQIVGVTAQRRSPRSRYGVIYNFIRDTPSRDIAADISDDSSIAEDTGLIEVQSLYSNVARQENLLQAFYNYDLTRRLSLGLDASYSDVEHGLPSAADVTLQSFIDFRSEIDGASPTELTDQDVFTVNGELDDYTEAKAKLGFRYKLTPIVTVSASVNHSQQVSQVEVDNAIDSLKVPDAEQKFILRNPRADSVTSTTTFSLGYERQLSEVLRLGIIGGVYNGEVDVTDSFDVPLKVERDPNDDGITKTDGWLASVGLNYDAGLTQYSAQFAVDVEPSSTGTQVETNELKGSVLRILSPRLRVSLSGRAYEPDRLVANADDRFARRFISFEPKVQWQYTRNWTLTAAYRYRRQKARVDPESSESNAVLFAIKYTPPSEIRDAARANGF